MRALISHKGAADHQRIIHLTLDGQVVLLRIGDNPTGVGIHQLCALAVLHSRRKIRRMAEILWESTVPVESRSQAIVWARERRRDGEAVLRKADALADVRRIENTVAAADDGFG